MDQLHTSNLWLVRRCLALVLFFALGTSPMVALPKQKSEHVEVKVFLEHQIYQNDADNWVALQFIMAPQWHIYWKNFGEVGLATKFKFELPEGMVLKELLWPKPELLLTDGIISYGYEGEVVFLANITGHGALGVEIKAQADWLECKQSCVPASASLVWTWGPNTRSPVGDADFFKNSRSNIPENNKNFENFTIQRDALKWQKKAEDGYKYAQRAYFFPEENGLLAIEPQQDFKNLQGQLSLSVPLKTSIKLKDISGVMRFWDDQGMDLGAVEIVGAKILEKSNLPVSPNSTPPESFAWMIFFAFLGGLILNVMPCVLPVLSLKIMHILEHRSTGSKSALGPALAYTLGVVSSFLVLALTLIFLRKAGEDLGWGFQLQSLGVVTTLMVIFLLLSLNLFGVFEVGLSLVGVDHKVKSNGGQWSSAFASGALATLAATPCTAPYMGAALGYALTLSTYESLSIFFALGLGMASPFLVVGLFPKCLSFLPKPGAWMVTLKQAMGFLLLGTVAYLYYVAATLVENKDTLLNIGFSLVIFSFAAWVYGNWGYGQGAKVWLARCWVVVLLALGTYIMQPTRQYIQWETYSEENLQKYLAQGRPVFLDFTASWCLSCKVNEQRVLNTVSTAELFKQHHIVAMKADWSKYDAHITKALERLGRNSVPVYAFYFPSSPTAPILLPEVLQFSDLEAALNQLSKAP